jgi:hypothetical protein
MARARCPQCGSEDLTAAEKSRLRCSGCGAQLEYRISPVALVLTWAVVAAAVAIAFELALGGLGGPASSIGRWVAFGVVTGVVAALVTTRLRRLRKV